MYASLCQVACDNLASNGLLGFIESFSGSYFCTICYATSEEIQVKFCGELFQLRTAEDNNKDVAGLTDAKKQGKVHCRGVKRYCKLNDIQGFHVTDNWTLDPMHIIFEGIVPVELGCILFGLCNSSNKCISLETVNKLLLLFWGKITVEKTHKPAEIGKLPLPGQGLAPSMKAVQ